jgi:undecaprenyl-diphosphatase
VLGPASRNTRHVAITVAIASVVLFAGLAALVATGAADGLDNMIRGLVHRALPDSLAPLVRAVTQLGSTVVLLALCAVAALTLFWFNRRRIALSLTLTLVATMLANTALKVVFQRARPEPYYGDILETFSFPSGHSAFSCCFYMSIAAIAAAHAPTVAARATIFAGATVLIAAIGFSRVYLGVHYPTDVLGGVLVAIVTVATARILDAPQNAAKV